LACAAGDDNNDRDVMMTPLDIARYFFVINIFYALCI